MFVLREYYSLSVEPATAEKNSKIRPYLLLIAKKFSTMVFMLYYVDLIM